MDDWYQITSNGSYTAIGVGSEGTGFEQGRVYSLGFYGTIERSVSLRKIIERVHVEFDSLKQIEFDKLRYKGTNPLKTISDYSNRHDIFPYTCTLAIKKGNEPASWSVKPIKKDH